MALPHSVSERICSDPGDWCGHVLAPDFKLVRYRSLALDGAPRTPMVGGMKMKRGRGGDSCSECATPYGMPDGFGRRARRCDECDQPFCESCQHFSFAGFVASDSFVCYRCHPSGAGISRLSHVRRSTMGSSSSCEGGRRKRCHTPF